MSGFASLVVFLRQPAEESLSFEKCLNWGGNGARSPWQFNQRRGGGGGGVKGASYVHTVEISLKENKWPPHVLQMPRAAPEMAS